MKLQTIYNCIVLGVLLFILGTFGAIDLKVEKEREAQKEILNAQIDINIALSQKVELHKEIYENNLQTVLCHIDIRLCEEEFN